MAASLRALFVCCYCLSAIVLGVQGKADYYDVLGVERSASYKEIRSSYKKLAKEWHPDKNRSPEAAQKFMEIKEAYEVLSDETARRRYDGGGVNFFDFDPFNIVITPFSRRRTFKARDDVINSDFFFNTVLPTSHTKPYLLYFYSDYDCFLCLNMDAIWSRLKKDPLVSRVGMATLSTRTMDVFDFVGVVEVPAIVSVVDEHFHYYPHIYHPSVTGVTQFLTATLLKSTLFISLTSDNLDSFLGTVVTANKPRLILFSSKPQPQLHHHLVAMAYRNFIAFGFVSTARGLNGPVAQRLGVPLNEETCVVFKENTQKAVGRSTTASTELLHFAKQHTLLELPRLSSPEHFKAVCNKKRSSGCLVLVVSGPTLYTSVRIDSWRSLRTSTPKAYVDASQQSTFLQSVNFSPVASITCEDGDTAWKVLGFKWEQKSLLSYTWMEWCPETSPASLVGAQWTAVEGGGGETDPSHLIDDEDGPGFLQRIWLKCETWLMRSGTSFKAFVLAYPQILMSAFMMVPLLCLLTLKKGVPLPELQQQVADGQNDDFLGFTESSTEEQELEEDSI